MLFDLARSYRMRQAQWRNVLAHAPKLRHDSFPIETPTKIHGALDRNTDERPISTLFGNGRILSRVLFFVSHYLLRHTQ
jgi:hypothetical protein